MMLFIFFHVFILLWAVTEDDYTRDAIDVYETYNRHFIKYFSQYIYERNVLILCSIHYYAINDVQGLEQNLREVMYAVL